jgi:5-formaminoimidazole-4-carboxamide-1-(beta)-D-ribofuranosyl 5'-monophosphate synthetase
MVPMVRDTGGVSIATLASHSSLQILHGARAEGFRTVLIVERSRLGFYSQFKSLIDELIVVDSFRELSRLVPRLRELNAIFVPHGSAVEYVGAEELMAMDIPIFGNRKLMLWESRQELKMRILSESGLPTPRVFSLGEDHEGLLMVKLPGAKGGRGYFIARNMAEARARLSEYMRRGLIRDPGEAIVQEYLVGVPMYIHYFNSPILGRLEIIGMDIRYETNVDSLGRLPHWLMPSGLEPTFVVVGNIPVVAREKMLIKFHDYGLRFSSKVAELTSLPMVGPFSLEGVALDEEDFRVFEFSGRIVAGTNLYVGTGSPYSWLYWNEPMSMGRRIAREIRMAIENNSLDKVLT